MVSCEKIKGILQGILETIRSIIYFAYDVKWQILVSVLGFLIFYSPAQIQEIYRIYSENGIVSINIGTLIAGTAALGFILRNNIYLGYVEANAKPNESPTRVIRLVIALLSTAPVIGAVLGAIAAVPQQRETDDEIRALTILQVILAAEFIGLLVWFYRQIYYDPLNADGSTRTFQKVLLLGFIISAIVSLPSFLALTSVLGVFGTLLIAVNFLSLLSCSLAYLTQLALKWRLPVIGLLIVLSLIFSAFDLNNNHSIRLIPPSSGRWMRKRPSQHGWKHARTGIALANRTGNIRCSSSRRRAAASMRPITLPSSWPGCRTSARISRSTHSSSARCRAAASALRYSPLSPRSAPATPSQNPA